MTPHQTGPTVLRWCKLDRDLPTAELFRSVHEPDLILAVHTVTDPAGTPFYRLVNMNIVQIAVSVAEPGGLGGPPEGQQPAIVTFEAEAVGLFGKRRIKVTGIIPFQQSGPVATMGSMTSPALTGTNRRVLVFIGGKFYGFIVMARVAKRLGRHRKHPDLTGTVRIMTRRAATFQSGVLHLAARCRLDDSVMTHCTQILAGGRQHIVTLPAMRIMAVGTTGNDNRMRIGSREQLRLVVVAHDAEFGPICQQLGIIVACVGVMTAVAFTGSYRPVHMLPRGFVVMALIAKRGSLRGEAILRCPTVRVMTGGAPVCQGRMDMLFSSRLTLVAGVAEIFAFRRQHLGRRAEVRIVTRDATVSKGGVNMLFTGGRIIVTL